jgi:uncharacterized protein with ATP-grasp and redox domains
MNLGRTDIGNFLCDRSQEYQSTIKSYSLIIHKSTNNRTGNKERCTKQVLLLLTMQAKNNTTMGQAFQNPLKMKQR